VKGTQFLLRTLELSSVFNVTIDLSELNSLGLGIETNLKEMVQEALDQLAVQTYGKIKELTGERLHTRREMFLENFQLDDSNPEEPTLILLGKAVWIDDGLPKDYLFDALINSPNSQPGKDGSKYMVVPFNSGPGQAKANTTSYQQDLIGAAKEAMKKQKVPWAKIAKDDQGRPIIGKIATIKNIKTPNKTGQGPGMGQGDIGQPRQGHTGIPFLQGASVYQKEETDSKGAKKISRNVLTFRTVSSAHPEKWHHPGLEATNIMEAGYDWAMEELEREILPKLFAKHFS
jgi:hypothetical protein